MHANFSCISESERLQIFWIKKHCMHVRIFYL